MILDVLAQSYRYETVVHGLAEAFAFLRRRDLADLANGRHEISGSQLFAMIVRGEGKPRTETKLEYHRRYIDVQFSVAGADVIGWRELSTCTKPDGGYDEKIDCGLFTDEPVTWLTLPPGAFTILFPSDAHAPMAGAGPLHKAVVKVAVA